MYTKFYPPRYEEECEGYVSLIISHRLISIKFSTLSYTTNVNEETLKLRESDPTIDISDNDFRSRESGE